MDNANVPPLVPEVVDLRAEFELLMREMGKEQWLTRDEAGKYTRKTTHAQYQGFKLYHQRLMKQRILVEKNSPIGRYVVGLVRPDGSIAFSHTPYRHSHKEMAVSEALRLSQKREAAFGVFRCVEVVGVRPEVAKKEHPYPSTYTPEPSDRAPLTLWEKVMMDDLEKPAGARAAEFSNEPHFPEVGVDQRLIDQLNESISSDIQDIVQRQWGILGPSEADLEVIHLEPSSD